MSTGGDDVEPPRQVRVHRKERDGCAVAGDVGDPLGKFARIAVFGDHPVPLAVPLREDRLDHRPRALRERVAPALAVGDDLGRPRVGAEQHDQARHDEGSRSRSARPRRRHVASDHHSVHRQDPIAHRPVGRGAASPAEPDEPQHAATLGTIGLEQFEHPGVVAAGLAGEVPAHRVGEVEVADGHRIVVAEDRPAHHADRPRADAGDEGELGRRLVGAERRPLPQPVGDRATATSVRARLTSMPSGMEPPRRHRRQPLGRGGSSRPVNGPGAGSPSRYARSCPLADRFTGRDPLADDRRQQGVIQVAAGAGGEAGALMRPPW